MKLKYPVILFILYLTVMGNCYGQSFGLGFYGNEVVQDKRTGLDLSPGESICFDKNFELSFELSFFPNYNNYFGYIVRIIQDDQKNIDLIYNRRAEARKHFQVTVGNQLAKIAFNIPQEKLFTTWNKIRLKLSNNVLTVYANGQAVSQLININHNSCFKILFGANNYGKFRTTDVPPMKIRNIEIFKGN